VVFGDTHHFTKKNKAGLSYISHFVDFFFCCFVMEDLKTKQEVMAVLPTSGNKLLAGHPSLQLSTEVKDWLQACPDQAQVNQWLTTNLWLRSKQQCVECGDEHARHELRYDVYGPFFDPSQLICHDCFEYFCLPTIANPEGLDKNLWPPFLVPGSADTSVYDSEFQIVDSQGSVIGKVSKYNPKSHTGMVTLEQFPECGEMGSLDPGCRVIDDDGQLIGPEEDQPKERYTDDVPMVYHVSLEDLLAEKMSQ
jgi:hypothetical protein